MEQIGFLGSFDKKDLLLNIAKTLTVLDYKVLIVDATLMQRLKYVVPYIGNNESLITYVAEYQGIDVALGFMALDQIAQFLGKKDLPYDFVLIDSDNVQTINSFKINELNKIFFVTSYDQYEVARMIETFQYYNKPMEVTKTVISADISEAHATYFRRLLENTPVRLRKGVEVQFIDSIEDRKVTLQNQLMKEIKFKHYTNTYKDSLEYITALIAEGIINQADIKRAIKKI